ETLYSAVYDLNTDVQLHDIDVDVTIATDSLGNEMVSIQEVDFFSVDNHGPAVVSITPSTNTISDSEVGNETFSISISYDEEMDTSSPPTVSFPVEDPMVNTLTIDSVASTWVDESNYVLVFDVVDAEEELSDIDVASAQAKDAFGNDQSDISTADVFNIDTKNPSYISSTISSTLVNDALAGASSISMQIDFDEEMDPAIEPILSFPDESPGSSLTQSSGIWIDGDSYEASFDVVDEDLVLLNVDIQVSIASDNAGNLMETHTVADFIDIEMENPSISNFNVDNTMISDLNLGENLEIGMKFSEPIDTDVTGTPVINYPESDVSGTLIFESANWLQEDSLSLSFSLTDEDLDVEDVDIEISGLVDMVGNVMNLYLSEDALSIEMLNPNVTNVILNTDLIDNSFIGPSSFTIEAEFSEPLNQTFDPQLAFPVEDPSSTLSFDASSSTWTSETSYLFVYDVAEGLSSLADIDVEIFGGIDLAGNVSYLIVEEDEFDIDIASSLSDQNISVMNIYPNPVIAGDALKIKLGESNGVYQFRLLDALGREVIFMNSNDSEIIEIPTSGLSSGAYLLHIANEESTAAFKVQIVE
ncbi:MAG: T9SS type A sorting domain-containing protein, partial [Flavobacteriales bacterium]|nr:T9SS type A sorting domain-containing protein [Flavobacteriales bacterium]